MSDSLNFEVLPEEEGQRLDTFLSMKSDGLTRSAAQRLIDEGIVKVSGKTCAKNYRLKSGDVVSAVIPPPKALDVKAEDIKLDIVYEDEALLVVNKPKGMVVHPAAGNYEGTLVNALLAHCTDLSGINGVIRPGIVHRIDKDTSGLLIVAKTNEAHLKLAEQIKEHSFERIYAAVLCGNIKEDSFTIDKPIARSKKDRKKMAVSEDGRRAVTHFTVLERMPKYTYVECRLETGRTHQIRVHASSIGHPVAGDEVYGKPENGLAGQCLHAKTIGFVHPVSGEFLRFESELPEYFKAFLVKHR
ncbi:MAG: RluA family pseudouridine synthase [Bacillota bacterium]|nr:RluA family pseudouridine synthase [Bacillota bacterium]